MKIYQTYSSEETKKIGYRLAGEVSCILPSLKLRWAGKYPTVATVMVGKPVSSCRRAAVLALRGDLGSGKTTFTQGFLRGLGIRKKAPSPTFVIFRKYKIKKNSDLRFKNKGFKEVYHFDCYRVKKAGELKILGVKEIFLNPENIILIEWPERIGRMLPKNKITVRFSYGKRENERVIRVDKV